MRLVRIKGHWRRGRKVKAHTRRMRWSSGVKVGDMSPRAKAARRRYYRGYK